MSESRNKTRVGYSLKAFISFINFFSAWFIHIYYKTSEQLISKIFSWKFTHISIIAGLYDNPVPRIKKCSLLHQVVSDVKNNNAKNFFV